MLLVTRLRLRLAALWLSLVSLFGSARSRAVACHRADGRVWPKNAVTCAVEVNAEDDWVRIVPIGNFQDHHTIPHEVTAEMVLSMAGNWKQRSTDLLIDFDHESMWGSTRAAGWSSEVEAREDGLYMRRPEWTGLGSAAIEAREYRYYSPVYFIESRDRSGNAIGATLHSVALTNLPYFEYGEIDPVGNSKETPAPSTSTDYVAMNRDALIALYGLAANATDADIEAAITASKAKADAADAAAEAATQAAENEADDEVPAWASKLVERVDSLETGQTARAEADQDARADALVNSAIQRGALLPADRVAYVAAAKSDFDGIKTDLDGRADNSALPNRSRRPVANGGSKPVRNGLLGRLDPTVAAYVQERTQ